MENCLESPEVIEFSLAKKIKIPIVMDIMGTDENDIILDVGSGGGYFTKILAERSRLVIGLDMSSTNAISAKRSVDRKNVFFVVGDATQLPFKNNVFGKILAAEIIEHIEDDLEFVKECERILKPGGSVVITAPCTNPTIPIDWLRRMSGVDLKSDFGHVRSGYTKGEIENLLNRIDLKIITFEYFSQIFTELIKIVTYFGRTLYSGGNNWTDGKDQLNLVHTKTFKLYKFLFPLLNHFSKLDNLMYKCRGYHFVIKASKLY